jgi:6-phosphogluconolactonase (cycloisomerase 2 family)
VEDYLYVSNTASDSVSSYRVSADGSLTLLEAQAITRPAGSAPTDMALIDNYMYVLNPAQGIITSYDIDLTDGSVQSLSNPVNILGITPGAQGVAAHNFTPAAGSGQIIYLPLIVR